VGSPPRQLSWWSALAATLAAAVVGLSAHAVAESRGWYFPSFGYLAGELIWKLTTIAIMFWCFRRWEHRRPNAVDVGLAADPNERRPSARLAVPALVAAVAGIVIVPSLIGANAGSGASYGTIHKAGLLLILCELLLRYPLTVFAEEMFFRGWLQPRLGTWAPVLTGVLTGLYHLQQAATIPQSIMIGVVLGIIRWWTGNIRASLTVHYISDASFFLATYV
jgi:membrane protease YdiL (CAAX protease family)